MGTRAAIAALLALALSAGSLALARDAARAEVPNISWTALLPPLASPNKPQPVPIATCRRATPACVQGVIRRLRARRDQLGCDHRAVFATTYLELTKQIRRDIRTGLVQRDFIWPRYLYREAAMFASAYLRISRAWDAGQDVPEAWRIAFRAAAADDKAGVQDMLLGINAHVQNDMPFVLAALGLRSREGRSRKPDHDAANGTLNRAYDRVIAAVRHRYDESLAVTNPIVIPVDDVVGLELARIWREGVWRNAERLVNAGSAAERARVAGSIEENAALSARLIATGGMPGYGATRDAYCAAGPAGAR